MTAKKITPLIILLGILTAGWWLTPDEVSRWPLCFFKYLTHIDCPGCGLTRSFLSMARGDLASAFRFNAAGPLLYLFFAAVFFERSLALWKKSFSVKWPKIWAPVYSALVVILLFGHWVLRVREQIF